MRRNVILVFILFFVFCSRHFLYPSFSFPFEFLFTLNCLRYSFIPTVRRWKNKEIGLGGKEFF